MENSPVYDNAITSRLAPGEMEMGLGIHGEPGASTKKIVPVREVVAELLDHIVLAETGYLPLQQGTRTAAMNVSCMCFSESRIEPICNRGHLFYRYVSRPYICAADILKE